MNVEVVAAKPDTDSSAEYQKLDPNHLKLDRLVGGIFAAVVSLFVVIGLALGAVINHFSLGIGFAIAVVLSVIAIVFLVWGGLVYPKFAYRHASWRLSPQGLEIRRGVWWRHRIIVPRSRIQHSDIEQGPMQRGYGIATLIVHTAGTKNSAVRLEGLATQTAQSLRDTLVSELSSRRSESIAKVADPEETPIASGPPPATPVGPPAPPAPDSPLNPTDEAGEEPQCTNGDEKDGH